MLDRITPIILTYNEAPNIARTLDALAWARDVLVVDSFSTDETLEIVRRYPNTRVRQRRFDTFAGQWTYAIEQGEIRTDWVLTLDADYVLTANVIGELEALDPPDDVAAYRAHFRYCVAGKPLRGSLYPPLVVLFRQGHARFTLDGHTYRVAVEGGRTDDLVHRIDHDDRKPLERWLASQSRYAKEEAHKLRSTRWSQLAWPDRARSVPLLAAPLVAAYCLAFKRCALDGRAGLAYTAQRVIAELILSLELVEQSQSQRRATQR